MSDIEIITMDDLLGTDEGEKYVLMSGTVFRYLLNAAYPNDLVQVMWGAPILDKITEFYEPRVTIARPDTP